MELYLRARQVHLCNPKTQGSLGRQTTGQPGLHRKTQSKKKKKSQFFVLRFKLDFYLPTTNYACPQKQ